MSAGIRIKITKISEDETSCTYEYRVDGEGPAGMLSIAKGDGLVQIRERLPNEPSDNRYAGRAANKLFWLYEKGEFPQETWFVS